MDIGSDNSTGSPRVASDRIIGWVRGQTDGPLLLCVGGLHGNEPAGVRGLEQVVESLHSRTGDMTGDFVAVAGNLSALAVGRRFLSYDLNRAWLPPRVPQFSLPGMVPAGFDPQGPPAAEDDEVGELLELLTSIAQQRRGPIYVLDIHTTSGGGGAFTTVADSLANRRFATQIPVPLVLGLEELVVGTLVGYLDQLGYTTAVFECGQHEEAHARDRAEWAVWLAIRAAGVLAPEAVPEAETAHRALLDEVRGLPRVVEMRHRHHVSEGDDYLTLPGFLNFQPVREGDVVGEDRKGIIVAPEGGRILMPLYQEQGEDGFFIVREFSRFWLWLSELLRVLDVGRFIHWLPGVRKDPSLPGTLVADRRVARWYALELFHLLGYRREVEDEHRLVVVQRERARRAE